MLKNPASGVLCSQESSTGTRPPHHSVARTNVVLLIRRTVRPEGTPRVLAPLAALLGNRRVQESVLADSGWEGEILAELDGEMSGLFEHPDDISRTASHNGVSYINRGFHSLLRKPTA